MLEICFFFVMDRLIGYYLLWKGLEGSVKKLFLVRELWCDDFIYLIGVVFLILDEFLEIGCDCVSKDVFKLLKFGD